MACRYAMHFICFRLDAKFPNPPSILVCLPCLLALFIATNIVLRNLQIPKALTSSAQHVVCSMPDTYRIRCTDSFYPKAFSYLTRGAGRDCLLFFHIAEAGQNQGVSWGVASASASLHLLCCVWLSATAAAAATAPPAAAATAPAGDLNMQRTG